MSETRAAERVAEPTSLVRLLGELGDRGLTHVPEVVHDGRTLLTQQPHERGGLGDALGCAGVGHGTSGYFRNRDVVEHRCYRRYAGTACSSKLTPVPDRPARVGRALSGAVRSAEPCAQWKRSSSCRRRRARARSSSRAVLRSAALRFRTVSMASSRSAGSNGLDR